MTRWTYLGAFRLPRETVRNVSPRPNAYPAVGRDADYFGLGGRPFAFDPYRQALVIGTRYSRATLVTIPEPRITQNNAELPFAQFIAAPRSSAWFADLTNNTWNQISDDLTWDYKAQAGLLPWGPDRIVVAADTSYDANNVQRRGHRLSEWPPASLTNVVTSPWQTVGDALKQGWTAGYMAPVPDAWRARLRGSAVTGSASLSIISRTSAGPALWSFDPEQLRLTHTVPATCLVGYPVGHRTLGEWEQVNEVYGISTQVMGVMLIDDLAVFVGSTGLGAPCYGSATSIEAEAGQPGKPPCYDPTSSYQGQHSYPYRAQAWIYELEDLALVADGELEPWEVRPTIDTFPELEPFIGPEKRLTGCAYDSERRRVYLCAYKGDAFGFEPAPVVHVFEVPRPPVVVEPNPLEQLVQQLQEQNAHQAREIVALRAELDQAQAQVARYANLFSRVYHAARELTGLVETV